MVIPSSHTALAEKVYHTAARKARKIRLGGGFSQFFIVNGANCPIKTKNPRIPAWFRFGRSALADDLLRRAEDHVIDVEALEVFKHHIGSHAPFSFQFQEYDTTSLSSAQV